MQPGNADAISRFEAPRVRPGGVHDTDDLMAWNDWRFANGKLAFDNVQIGAANSTGPNLDSQLIAYGIRSRDFGPCQRIRFNGAGRLQQTGLHPVQYMIPV